MSEYQYFEFAALDGPISDEGLRYAESCSSRADVSRYHWRNIYNFGDFRGSEDRMLQYYDAHFYHANWGTTRFALAFPAGCLEMDVVSRYARPGLDHDRTLSFRTANNRTLLWWNRENDDGETWVEGEGTLQRLMGIREELMRGDLRALFLGWLADLSQLEREDEPDPTDVLPPIPSGLDQLSPALRVLTELFPVDPDALAIAGGQSPSTAAERTSLASALDQLPVSQLKTLLIRVADGDETRVRSELNRMTYPKREHLDEATMTLSEFETHVERAREARRIREARAETTRRKRKAEARSRHLSSILQQAESLWSDLHARMEEKNAAHYDDIAHRLHDLRDAYHQAGREALFQEKLADFRNRYRRRPGITRRINDL